MPSSSHDRPSSTLVLFNAPADFDIAAWKQFCGQCPGVDLSTARAADGQKQKIFFIDFADVSSAVQARRALILQEFHSGGLPRLGFAKPKQPAGAAAAGLASPAAAMPAYYAIPPAAAAAVASGSIQQAHAGAAAMPGPGMLPMPDAAYMPMAAGMPAWAMSAAPGAVAAMQPAAAAPGAGTNCTLYVESVPADATEREMSHIFRPFPGFRSLRLITRAGDNAAEVSPLCFVEFASTAAAAAAQAVLQNYVMDLQATKPRTLRVSFAKSNTAGQKRRRGKPQQQ